MKTERWSFQKGENVLFYVSEENANPSVVSVNCYHPGIGKKQNLEMKLVEPDIYMITVDLKVMGKYLLTFYEDGQRTLIVIATVA